MLGSPDAGRPLHDSSNALHPSIVAPSPFGEAPPGGDFTLPRIGGSKPTLGGGSRAASRKGGGFRVGHAQRDKKLRQAMSAPTGLVDLLSAEERRTLTDISQAGRQLHFQAPDTPGSVSGFFHSPGGVPQSPGIAGSGLQQYVESEMRGLSDDGMEQRGAHLIVSKTKGQFFAGGVSTPEVKDQLPPPKKQPTKKENEGTERKCLYAPAATRVFSHGLRTPDDSLSCPCAQRHEPPPLLRDSRGMWAD